MKLKEFNWWIFDGGYGDLGWWLYIGKFYICWFDNQLRFAWNPD